VLAGARSRVVASEYFGMPVEVFTALADPSQMLFRSGCIARKLRLPRNQVSMYLARRKHVRTNIFQATDYVGIWPDSAGAMRPGAYFLSIEACREYEAYTRRAPRRLRQTEIDLTGSASDDEVKAASILISAAAAAAAGTDAPPGAGKLGKRVFDGGNDDDDDDHKGRSDVSPVALRRSKRPRTRYALTNEASLVRTPTSDISSEAAFATDEPLANPPPIALIPAAAPNPATSAPAVSGGFTWAAAPNPATSAPAVSGGFTWGPAAETIPLLPMPSRGAVTRATDAAPAGFTSPPDARAIPVLPIPVTLPLSASLSARAIPVTLPLSASSGARGIPVLPMPVTLPSSGSLVARASPMLPIPVTALPLSGSLGGFNAEYAPFLQLDVVRFLLFNPATATLAVQMIDALVAANRRRAQAESVLHILPAHLHASLYDLLRSSSR
jgi:hypothetical protein